MAIYRNTQIDEINGKYYLLDMDGEVYLGRAYSTLSDAMRQIDVYEQENEEAE